MAKIAGDLNVSGDYYQDGEKITTNHYSLFGHGSDLDFEGHTVQLTAAEAVSPGQVGQLSSNQDIVLALGDTEANADGRLVLALENLSSGESGVFLLSGSFRDDSLALTVGSELWLSASTAGGFSETQPSASGEIVRKIGVATDTNHIEFDPAKSYIEVA